MARCRPSISHSSRAMAARRRVHMWTTTSGGSAFHDIFLSMNREKKIVVRSAFSKLRREQRRHSFVVKFFFQNSSNVATPFKFFFRNCHSFVVTKLVFRRTIFFFKLVFDFFFKLVFKLVFKFFFQNRFQIFFFLQNFFFSKLDFKKNFFFKTFRATFFKNSFKKFFFKFFSNSFSNFFWSGCRTVRIQLRSRAALILNVTPPRCVSLVPDEETPEQI